MVVELVETTPDFKAKYPLRQAQRPSKIWPIRPALFLNFKTIIIPETF